MGTDKKKAKMTVEKEDKKTKKKMGKLKKTLLIILGVFVALILAGVIFLLFNPTYASHLVSLWKSFTMTEEELLRETEKDVAKREETVENTGLNSDALSHDLIGKYITEEQHGEILLGIKTLEQALAENGYVATYLQKYVYASELLTREQYVYIIVGEKNFEKTLSENGYVISDELKKAYDGGDITAEQYVRVLKGEISLDEALGMLVVTEELNNALVEGRITREQYAEIIEGRLTLEQALEDNSKSEQPAEDEQPAQNTEETTGDTPKTEETPEIKPDVKGDGKTEENNPPEQNAPPESSKNPDNQTVVEDEASKALKSGRITTDQYTQIVLGELTLEQAISMNEEKKEESSESTDVSDYQRRKAELINRMYVLRSNYISQIDGIIASMKSEYVQLPLEERTLSAKQSIASKYISQIDAMEKQCDAQVKAVVDELRQLLKENGEDTSLADTIWQTYVSEKENTKAYYISTYGD